MNEHGLNNEQKSLRIGGSGADNQNALGHTAKGKPLRFRKKLEQRTYLWLVWFC